jgi:hypothetical protein
MNEDKKKKDFIEDGLENEEIVRIIKEILEKKKNGLYKDKNEMDRYEAFKKDYEFFANRYPMLFELVLRNDNFNWDNLYYMLGMRNKIIENKMTPENASKQVGQVWFDKYVDVSKLGKPNKKQKH